MKKYLIGILVVVIAVAVYLSMGHGSKSTSDSQAMNLYIGTNYIAGSTVTRFEKECNCRLTQNYFNANEEMLAKIAAGATGYNVIVPTSYAVDQLIKMDKLKPLDLSKLPNLKYIDPKFLNQAYDPGNKYSVPYAYTAVFLAYNQKKMNELGITPNTWAVIFEPQYLKKLKGHVTIFDSARNVFAAALLYLGKDPNSTNPADLKAAEAVIVKAKPYWARFDSDNYYTSMLRGDIWLAMSYSNDIFNAMHNESATNIRLGAQMQKEGNMYELDNLVIPVFTPNEKLSYMFINEALDPQSAYELAEMTGSSIPNTSALKKLSPAIRNTPWIYPQDMSKNFVFKAYDPQTRNLVNQMWTQIKL